MGKSNEHLVAEIQKLDPNFVADGWKNKGLARRLAELQKAAATQLPAPDATPVSDTNNEPKADAVGDTLTVADLEAACLSKAFPEHGRSMLCKKCLKSQVAIFEGCKAVSLTAGATPKASNTAKGGSAGGTRAPKFVTFQDLENFFLVGTAFPQLTYRVDRMLFQGLTPAEIHSAVETVKALAPEGSKDKASKDFKNEGNIRAHIRFRAKQGWMIENDNDHFTVTGISREPQDIVTKKPNAAAAAPAASDEKNEGKKKAA